MSNVAGYPAGMTTAQSSYKSLQSFADLTQLWTDPNADRPNRWLEKIVQRRQPNGSFPTYVS